MKLPGINYRTNVQGLGRRDPGLRTRLASAQSKAVTGLLNASNEVYTRVEEQRALNLWTQTERQMNDLETDFKTRPATTDEELKKDYDQQTSQIVVDAEKKLGGLSKKLWQSKFSDRSSKTRFRLTTGNALNLAKQNKAFTQDNIASLAKTDLPAAIQSIEDSPLLSDIEKTTARKEAIVINDKAQIVDALYSNDPVLMQKQIDRLKKGNSTLGELDVKKRIGWLETAKTEAISGEVAQASFERGERASNLELAVYQKKAGPDQIEEAYRKKDRFGETDISATTRTRLTKMWLDGKKEGAKIAQQDAMLSELLATGQPADPKNDDIIAAIDRRYEVAAEQIKDLPPVQKRAAQQQLDESGIDLAARTNILPKQMKAALRTYAFAGSPDDVARQANIYQVLQQKAGNTIDGISPDTRSVYEQTSAQMNAGRSALDAVTTAKENVLAPPEIKAGLAKKYKEVNSKLLGGSNTFDRLDDLYDADPLFDVEFFGRPTPTPIQVIRFQSLEFADFQNNGGDREQAQATAWNEYKRIHGGSKLANKEGDMKVMAFPPERAYGINPDEIRRQLTSATKPYTLDAKTAFLTSDNQTMRDKVKTYKVWAEDEFGLPVEVYTPDGRPMRWSPSVDEYSKFKTEEAQKQQDILEEQRLEPDDEDFELGGAGGQVDRARQKAIQKEREDKLLTDYEESWKVGL